MASSLFVSRLYQIRFIETIARRGSRAAVISAALRNHFIASPHSGARTGVARRRQRVERCLLVVATLCAAIDRLTRAPATDEIPGRAARRQPADARKTMSVPELPNAAARTLSLSCSVYWFASEKCVANFLASESSDAKASVLKD